MFAEGGLLRGEKADLRISSIQTYDAMTHAGLMGGELAVEVERATAW